MSRRPLIYTGLIAMPADGEGSASVDPINRRFLIGAERALNPCCFADVTVDEVRIWNVARTPAEIQSTMNTALTGSEPGLLLYYDFDEGVPGGDNTGVAAVANRVPGGSPGTIVGMARAGTSSNFVDGSWSEPQ